MNIGVISLPLHNNFGGILQAYALQKVLRDLGHNAVLIDKSRYVNLGPWYIKYPIYIKNVLLKYIMRQKVVVRPDVEINKIPKTIAQHTEPFIDKYIKRIYTKDFSNIKKNKFDAFVIGSDQVWRPRYFGTRIENAYLDFAKEWDVKRIAYASSFGAEEWEYTNEQTSTCSELLKIFNAVSVRESSAVGLCKEKFGVKAEHVLDPTMLLDKEIYIKLFAEAKTAKSEGNLFCYILDESKEKNVIINTISEEKGLTPFYVNSRYENPDAPLEKRIQQPVEKWLRAFHDAEFIITDSFHACVFSIIFNKPFIVYGNKERGLARFESLLRIFGLQERIATSPDEIYRIANKAINWDSINGIHREWKEKSISFLTDSLQEL